MQDRQTFEPAPRAGERHQSLQPSALRSNLIDPPSKPIDDRDEEPNPQEIPGARPQPCDSAASLQVLEGIDQRDPTHSLSGLVEDSDHRVEGCTFHPPLPSHNPLK